MPYISLSTGKRATPDHFLLHLYNKRALMLATFDFSGFLGKIPSQPPLGQAEAVANVERMQQGWAGEARG
jgi:hypothetical protein